ncbi:hypothetical protein [Caproicibacter sp.]|uniref:hypothetical protein n=1 Tax=Caproicibacter sp. TaxID=2814884 RepID=UPI003988DC6B
MKIVLMNEEAAVSTAPMECGAGPSKISAPDARARWLGVNEAQLDGVHGEKIPSQGRLHQSEAARRIV